MAQQFIPTPGGNIYPDEATDYDQSEAFRKVALNRDVLDSAIRWDKGRATPGGTPSMSDLAEGYSGLWTAADAQHYGIPVAASGAVIVYRYGNFKQAMFLGYFDGEPHWYANSWLGSSWTGWARVDAGAARWSRGRATPAKYPKLENLPEGFNGIWTAADAQHYGVPIPAGGAVIIYPYGNFKQAVFHAYFDGGPKWFGNTWTGSSWTGWQLVNGESWGKGRVSPATHPTYDSWPEGFSSIWTQADALAYEMPAPAGGTVNKFVFGNLKHLTYMVYSDGKMKLYANYGSSVQWAGWSQIGGEASTPGGVEGGPVSGFKSAPLALGQQSAAGTETISNDAVRWPFRFSVGGRRGRLHIRNWHYYSATTRPGAVSFTGAWFGKSSGANFVGAPTRLLNAFTTPANGDEYVSPWFNIDHVADTDQLLSVGFTNTAGQVNAQSRAGCYRSGNASDASLASGFGGSVSTTAPFDVWLELEVPADTPIVGGLGDSNTVGTGTAMPTYDAWLSQYCREAKALPYFMGVHGSTTASWDTADKPAWDHYAGTAKPDSVVYFLGQNDLQDGVTLATLQANLAKVLPIVRDKLTPNVYAATITPANSKPASVNTTRKAYNTWLKANPLGVKDCFDFSAAISDDDATIRAADNADGLHILTSGHTKMAAKISARPIVPEVLTESEKVALRALL